MRVYYNDNDPFCVDWIRNLLHEGHVPDGILDDRSITEVEPEDVRGFERCHFFAGILGWELALQWAGFPNEETVWTASLPCQPFSSAGKQRGTDDDRHLWPVFFRLVDECRPGTIFGEQVLGAVRLGWLDVVFSDLERIGYSCWSIGLGAQDVGAPQIRKRLWWVAYVDRERQDGEEIHEGRGRPRETTSDQSGADGGVADTDSIGRREGFGAADRELHGNESAGVRGDVPMADPDGRTGQPNTGSVSGISGREDREEVNHPGRAGEDDGQGGYPFGSIGHESDHRFGCRGDCGLAGHCCKASVCYDPNRCDGQRGSCYLARATGEYGRTGTGGEDRQEADYSGGVGNPVKPGLEGHTGDGDKGREPRRDRKKPYRPIAPPGASSGMGHTDNAEGKRFGPHGVQVESEQKSERPGYSTAWYGTEFIGCADGKARPVKPGIHPLASGVPGRVGRLRAYGNSIALAVGAVFVKAFMELRDGER